MAGNVHQSDKDKLKATVDVAADQSIEVTQADPTKLKGTVTQASAARTVTNAIAANLKAEVTQAAKDRTITGMVLVQNPAAYLLQAEVTEKPSSVLWKRHDNQSTAQTNKQLRTAPPASRKLYITDIIMSTDTAMNIKLVEDTTGTPATVFGPLYFAANGGCVVNLKTLIKLSFDVDLGYTSSGNGNHTVVVCGFYGV